MQRKYFFFLLTMLAAGFVACDKMLEEKPKATVMLGELTPNTLNQTVIGVYEPWTRSRGRLWESTIGLGFELMSEYTDGGASQQSWSNYNNVMSNPNALRDPWTTLYEAIGRANQLIAALDANTTLSDDLKKPAYGEAYFVRAVSYFFAVRTWGKVPMRLKPISDPDNTALALSETPAIYDQIVKDLQYAETALPAKFNGGRATSGAAKAALADVYLNRGDLPNARVKAKEIIDGRATWGYDLEPNFQTLFSPTLATNREDIFSLKFTQVLDRGAFLASYWADSRAQAAGFSVRGNKFGGIISQAPLVKNWNNADLRKQWTLYTTYLVNGVVTNAEVEAGSYDIRMGKYRDPNAPSDTGNGNDFYFWRYADVLLIYAEAENKLSGPTPAAYESVNKVRRRAFGLPADQASNVSDLPAGLTMAQFDDMVFRERGYEFMGECKRWFDMVRTGRAAALIGEVRAAIPNPGRKPVPTKFLFALPDIELQNNPLAK
ncbi:RagB/SusD family nutrient uptake outer membrane protein [Chitinophaga lutea]